MDQKTRLAPELPSGGHTKRGIIYDVGTTGHYGACQQLIQSDQGGDPDIYGGIWSNINQGLHGSFREILATYWMATLRNIEEADHNYKEHQLPLARIKKVMKADPEVKMISAEAPILFAKGCDIFITELTMRAWIHAEENKRRTLQRSDIAAALSKSDMFDFLIDIVPREEATQSHSKRSAAQTSSAAANQSAAAQSMAPPQTQMPVQQPHHPQPHEYQQYMTSEPDYRQPQMYSQDQGYGHPQGPMGFDPNQGMYGGYAMQPHQMYQNQPGPPPPPSHGYRQHDGGEGNGDAEGERDYDVS